MFSCEFGKIFKNVFFTGHLRTTASEFFYLFYCFLPTGEARFFSIFVSSRLSNVMVIVNLNDLVVVAWKHKFLGDITWNLAVFL